MLMFACNKFETTELTWKKSSLNSTPVIRFVVFHEKDTEQFNVENLLPVFFYKLINIVTLVESFQALS